jgi:DNA-directed RNA polymerase subunit RPC12/RpoP
MANILGQNGQPKIDISTSKPIVCNQCGYDVFLPGTKMRKISKLMAGTDQDVLIPFEILICSNCGEILDEMLPAEIKALEKLDAMKADKKDESKSGLIL